MLCSCINCWIFTSFFNSFEDLERLWGDDEELDEELEEQGRLAPLMEDLPCLCAGLERGRTSLDEELDDWQESLGSDKSELGSWAVLASLCGFLPLVAAAGLGEIRCRPSRIPLRFSAF